MAERGPEGTPNSDNNKERVTGRDDIDQERLSQEQIDQRKQEAADNARREQQRRESERAQAQERADAARRQQQENEKQDNKSSNTTSQNQQAESTETQAPVQQQIEQQQQERQPSGDENESEEQRGDMSVPAGGSGEYTSRRTTTSQAAGGPTPPTSEATPQSEPTSGSSVDSAEESEEQRGDQAVPAGGGGEYTSRRTTGTQAEGGPSVPDMSADEREEAEDLAREQEIAAAAKPAAPETSTSTEPPIGPDGKPLSPDEDALRRTQSEGRKPRRRYQRAKAQGEPAGTKELREAGEEPVKPDVAELQDAEYLLNMARLIREGKFQEAERMRLEHDRDILETNFPDRYIDVPKDSTKDLERQGYGQSALDRAKGEREVPGQQVRAEAHGHDNMGAYRLELDAQGNVVQKLRPIKILTASGLDRYTWWPETDEGKFEKMRREILGALEVSTGGQPAPGLSERLAELQAVITTLNTEGLAGDAHKKALADGLTEEMWARLGLHQSYAAFIRADDIKTFKSIVDDQGAIQDYLLNFFHRKDDVISAEKYLEDHAREYLGLRSEDDIEKFRERMMQTLGERKLAERAVERRINMEARKGTDPTKIDEKTKEPKTHQALEQERREIGYSRISAALKLARDNKLLPADYNEEEDKKNGYTILNKAKVQLGEIYHKQELEQLTEKNRADLQSKIDSGAIKKTDTQFARSFDEYITYKAEKELGARAQNPEVLAQRMRTISKEITRQARGVALTKIGSWRKDLIGTVIVIGKDVEGKDITRRINNKDDYTKTFNSLVEEHVNTYLKGQPDEDRFKTPAELAAEKARATLLKVAADGEKWAATAGERMWNISLRAAASDYLRASGRYGKSAFDGREGTWTKLRHRMGLDATPVRGFAFGSRFTGSNFVTRNLLKFRERIVAQSVAQRTFDQLLNDPNNDITGTISVDAKDFYEHSAETGLMRYLNPDLMALTEQEKRALQKCKTEDERSRLEGKIKKSRVVREEAREYYDTCLYEYDEFGDFKNGRNVYVVRDDYANTPGADGELPRIFYEEITVDGKRLKVLRDDIIQVWPDKRGLDQVEEQIKASREYAKREESGQAFDPTDDTRVAPKDIIIRLPYGQEPSKELLQACGVLRTDRFNRVTRLNTDALNWQRSNFTDVGGVFTGEFWSLKKILQPDEARGAIIGFLKNPTVDTFIQSVKDKFSHPSGPYLPWLGVEADMAQWYVAERLTKNLLKFLRHENKRELNRPNLTELEIHDVIINKLESERVILKSQILGINKETVPYWNIHRMKRVRKFVDPLGALFKFLGGVLSEGIKVRI